MNEPQPGYVDFYLKGRIFEVDSQDPESEARCVNDLLNNSAESGDDATCDQLRAQYSIREIGIAAEFGTNDLRNPLWLKIDTSRRLIGTQGSEVDPHIADLIRNAGVIGDGRTGNPIAFCICEPHSARSVIWHLNPYEIAVISRRQIEDRLVKWVEQAITEGKLL